MDVDPDDWGIFIGAHLTDLSGFTADQQFLMGDLDSDGDNDFSDYLIFEAAYDFANGPGAFQQLVPEPATALLLLMGLGFASRLRRPAALMLIVGIAISSGAITRPVTAQLTDVQLNGWETGLENWVPFPNGNIPTSIDLSTAIGVTEGVQALAVTQDEETFSYAAQVNYGSGSAAFDAIASAVEVGASNYAIEFDVTFDTSSIPQGIVSSVSTTVALNSNGGWIEYGGVAGSTGDLTETVHVSIPLDQVVNPPTNSTGSGQLAPATETSFYQVNFGLDGDWGLDPATFFFDDLRLVQLTEPARLMIEVDRSDGSITLKNENDTGSLDVNYYTIGSRGQPGFGWLE